MQPEQTPQSTPPNPSQQGTSLSVPEYLHLDPIPDPQLKKSHKKPILVVGISLLVLIVTGGAIAYLAWQSGSADRQFYDALNNAMQTKFVNRKFAIISKNPDVNASVQSASDFSNPKKPKTQLNYIFDQPGATVGAPPAALHTEGNLIIEDTDYFFARITKAPAGVLSTVPSFSSLRAIELGQWYQVPDPLVDPYDPSSLRFLNSSLGILNMGNFDSTQRNDLLDFIKTNKIYDIRSTNREKLNGVQTTKYTVKVDNLLLNQLNQKAAADLGTKNDFDATVSLASVQKLEFWVDSSTSQFVKLHLENMRKGDTSESKRDITFDYPPNTQIDLPKNPVIIKLPPRPSNS